MITARLLGRNAAIQTETCKDMKRQKMRKSERILPRKRPEKRQLIAQKIFKPCVLLGFFLYASCTSAENGVTDFRGRITYDVNRGNTYVGTLELLYEDSEYRGQETVFVTMLSRMHVFGRSVTGQSATHFLKSNATLLYSVGTFIRHGRNKDVITSTQAKREGERLLVETQQHGQVETKSFLCRTFDMTNRDVFIRPLFFDQPTKEVRIVNLERGKIDSISVEFQEKVLIAPDRPKIATHQYRFRYLLYTIHYVYSNNMLVLAEYETLLGKVVIKATSLEHQGDEHDPADHSFVK